MPNAASCEQETWHQSGPLLMLCGLTFAFMTFASSCVSRQANAMSLNVVLSIDASNFVGRTITVDQ